MFIVSWFVFAIFDLNFDREIFVAYTASDAIDPEQGQPKLFPRAVTEYRVQQDKVVSRTGDFLNEYEDCTIFDAKNWTCAYSDGSATFGANQGEFFSKANLEKFPHLGFLAEEKALSRFRYILLQCRWDATGGFNAILCLIRPFTT
ncbi:hypothetical protein [Roseivivax sp.]